MKFSQCTSAAIAALLLSLAGMAQQRATKGYNELTLAGLRPGRDTLAIALKHYKSKYSSGDSDKAAEKQWSDPCTGHSLSLNLDEHAVIQEITVSSLVPLDGKCESGRVEALDEKDWITGRGLHLGDPEDRVSELYGEPNSSGPSVRDNNELEFLYYQFDGLGPDVPQAMQIYCARDTGRVVEITLAYPSL